ncbi:unnamed protein product [Brassicogethes aeneus]|uniref:Adenosine deaminase n=1 Tax=Brassicogethes aeneus TaxID=1431903 RepID=A0A9P0ALE7_BRAAE|nr:unnamed protein product [Brassicogethes aeneus]
MGHVRSGTLFLVLFISGLFLNAKSSYWDDREKFIRKEKSRELGADLVLNEKEEKVNEILMNYKLRELDEGMLNPAGYLPAQHFFHSKKAMDKSKVFNLIQKLPKGASLHSHDTGIASEEFLLSLTHKENLYGCERGQNFLLKFFKDNSSLDNSCQWKSLKKMRAQRKDFEEFLRGKLSLVVADPMVKYPDLNSVWRAFINLFRNVGNMIGYKPVFQEYFYQVLKELHEDNVMYMEMRGLLPEVYDLDGKIYSPEEVVGLYVETLEHFKHDYPSFYGAKLIYAPSRHVDNSTVDNYLKILKNIQKLYPDFIAGFDLVGQEDLGKPLSEFIPQLLEIKDQTKFFFHAGETNWEGETDLNLIDAVLLNTTRIGHGYAILKHPEVYRAAKKNRIAIEVSPISNQVLKLVDDLRNHPAAILVADGYPVVICCDDPSFWGAKGLSYDWYYAFMSFGSRDSDLKLLKQLAINSIAYSSLDLVDNSDLLTKWQLSWNTFIDDVLKEHGVMYSKPRSIVDV